MAGSAGGVQDLASIQKVVDALPELNRQKREVAKHVAICSDLSRRVAPMFAVSEAQQELLMTAAVPGAPLPEAVFHQGWSAPLPLRCVFPAGLIGGFPAVYFPPYFTVCEVAAAVDNESAPAVDRVNLIAIWAMRCR